MSIKRIIILVFAIISFIVFGKTLNGNFVWFWSASGHFWQNRWEKVLEFFGHNEFNVNVYGTILVTNSVFWIVGTLFTIVDLTGKPAFLLKYKIQEPNSEYPVCWSQVSRVIKQAAINQLFQTPFVLIGYYMLKLKTVELEVLPTFNQLILDLFVCISLYEISFYYSHRFLHKPLLYKYVHKYHHEWQTPIAIVSLDVHPVEHLLVNILPASLGPSLMCSHTFTVWLWLTSISLFGLIVHSGYHLPFLPSPENHDYHHIKFNENFGFVGFGLLDRLNGTDSSFRNSKNYERDQMLFNMVPAKELHPVG